MGCIRAKQLLSLAGYELEVVNVSDPAGRERFLEAGFSVVPMVVIGGRTIAGWPEVNLRRELGMSTVIDPSEAQRRLKEAQSTLIIAANLCDEIPDSYFNEPVLIERDRPLSQWIWHIFEFPREVMTAASSGVWPQESFAKMSDRDEWERASEYVSFRDISEFGRGVVEILTRWAERIDEALLEREIKTPFGVHSVGSLLDHVHRHSAIHFWQLVDRLDVSDSEISKRIPSTDLGQVPRYADINTEEESS